MLLFDVLSIVLIVSRNSSSTRYIYLFFCSTPWKELTRDVILFVFTDFQFEESKLNLFELNLLVTSIRTMLQCYSRKNEIRTNQARESSNFAIIMLVVIRSIRKFYYV